MVDVLKDSEQPPDGGREGEVQTWVILGGGSAKGVAHVGAWRAIQEAEIPVAGIIGTSAGAIMGAAIAGGRSIGEFEEYVERVRRRDVMRVNRRAVWVNGIRSRSVLRGDTLRRSIRDLLPTERWDELIIPLTVNAVDLESGELVWFGHGGDQDAALIDSVYASAALPLLFPPAEVGGQLLVDGGALDMLPLERAWKLGATRIIAIDVGADPEADAQAVVDGGMVAIHMRVFGLMAGHARREAVRNWMGVPLTYVRPNFGDADGFDFEKRAFFLEEGYRATREALAAPASLPAT